MSGRLLPASPALSQLLLLIRRGHLSDVQKYLHEAPVLNWKRGDRRQSPLLIAIRTGFYSMVEVLLEAEIGKEEMCYALSQALDLDRLDMIQLLCRFGADAKTVPYGAVVRTHDPEILCWFEGLGVDLIADNPVAMALMNSFRPALGTLMRCKASLPELQRQASMALRFHAREGNMKWVSLLLWAGADARAQVPALGRRYPDDDGTALYDAIAYERWDVVDKFKIDPAIDDLNRLLYEACSSANKRIIAQLLALEADPTVAGLYSPVDRCMWTLSCALEKVTYYTYEHRDATDVLCLFASKGAKWKPPEECSMKYLRMTLAKANPGAAVDTLTRLVGAGFFDQAVFKELMSTPRMKKLLLTGRPGVVQLRTFAGHEARSRLR